MLCGFLRSLACLENLLNRPQEPVGVTQHELVELLSPRVIDRAALQRLEIEPDGRDRCLQFVRDGVDEAVMLLVPTNLPHQEAGIDDHPSDQHSEEDHAQEQQDPFAPVEDDPADVERHRQCDQAHAQRDKERNRPAARDNAHRDLVPRRLYLVVWRGHSCPRAPKKQKAAFYEAASITLWSRGRLARRANWFESACRRTFRSRNMDFVFHRELEK